MKYLQTYKLFESSDIEQVIKDILLPRVILAVYEGIEPSPSDRQSDILSIGQILSG